MEKRSILIIGGSCILQFEETELRIDHLSIDEKQVFCKLQKDGPLTKKGLLEHFEYKPSTLYRNISALLEKRAIVEFGQEDS